MSRPRIAFGHGNPTALQRRAWDLVQQTGSQIEAARLMGQSQGSLQSHMRGYQHAMGLTGPLPGARVYRSGVRRGEGVVGSLRARVAELERERDEARAALVAEQRANEQALHDLLARIADLQEQAHPWVSIHAKLDALMARPSGAPVVTHRRIRDGGVGGKRERRGEVAA